MTQRTGVAALALAFTLESSQLAGELLPAARIIASMASWPRLSTKGSPRGGGGV